MALSLFQPSSYPGTECPTHLKMSARAKGLSSVERAAFNLFEVWRLKMMFEATARKDELRGEAGELMRGETVGPYEVIR